MGKICVDSQRAVRDAPRTEQIPGLPNDVFIMRQSKLRGPPAKHLLAAGPRAEPILSYG